LFVGGAYQSAAGDYVDSLSTASGCDSLVTTTLTISPVITNSVSASICSGDSLFVGGAYQSAAGDYVDSLSTASGCDSLVTTTLTISPVITNSVSASICSGDSLFIGGAYQSAAGDYVDSLSTASGCDSLVTTTLTISPVITNSVSASICSGDSLFIGGAYQSAAGAYLDSFSSASGCDSLVTTTLTISPVITNSVSSSICSGDSLFVGGAYQSAAGVYLDSFSSASGCDSLVTTTLSVTTASSSTDIQQAACDFTWIDGVTYTASNSTATFTTSNALGCDSVVTLDLTIDPIVASIAQNGNDIEASATNGVAPYSYDWSTGETTASITPAANGPYWVVVSDVDDCLSDTTSFDVTFVSGTGILTIENVFNIYPNPTNDMINIDAKGNSQYLSATVYDIFGKLLINTNNNKISLNKFEDGVYILEINTPTKTFTTRVIKH
jgi:phosphosulfolactate synthase (CoM biosynthesis protein A)